MTRSVSSVTIKSRNDHNLVVNTKLTGSLKLIPVYQTLAKNIYISNDSYNQLQYQAITLLNKPFNLISRINRARPLLGNILLLGQKCTSVLNADKDPDDEYFKDIYPKGIVLYDGCKSCLPDCQEILNLFLDIRNYHVWLNSVKDILLYNLDVCSSLYNNLYNDIGSYSLDNNGLLIDKSIKYCSTSTLPSRDLWLYGIRLVYQYKALVALWNYLADSSARRIQISTAALDFSGINIIWKSMLDLCKYTLTQGLSPDAVLLRIGIRFSVSVNNPQGLPLDKQGVPKGKFALFFVTDNNNTYIKHIQKLANSIYLSTNNGSVSGQDISMSNNFFSILSKISDKIVRALLTMASIVNASVLFIIKPSIKLGGQALLAAFIKVIPIWVPLTLSDHIITLSDYEKFRMNNTLVPLNSGFNTWTVTYLWYSSSNDTNQVLTSDSNVYKTPHTRVPTTLLISLLT